MPDNVTENQINLTEICKIETLINKLQNAIKSYHLGLYPAWIFAYKIDEYSKALTSEVENG